MEKRTPVAIVILVIVLVFFVFGVFLLHPFGVPDETAMDTSIMLHTQGGTGINTGVVSIVFDYRGFDTVVEVVALFAAVAGVLMIFRRSPP